MNSIWVYESRPGIYEEKSSRQLAHMVECCISFESHVVLKAATPSSFLSTLYYFGLFETCSKR